MHGIFFAISVVVFIAAASACSQGASTEPAALTRVQVESLLTVIASVGASLNAVPDPTGHFSETLNCPSKGSLFLSGSAMGTPPNTAATFTYRQCSEAGYIFTGSLMRRDSVIYYVDPEVIWRSTVAGSLHVTISGTGSVTCVFDYFHLTSNDLSSGTICGYAAGDVLGGGEVPSLPP